MSPCRYRPKVVRIMCELVKAGLLPRLSRDVIAIYVESAPEETETRILRALRKRIPELPQDLALANTFAALRRREGLTEETIDWHARIKIMGPSVHIAPRG